MPSFAGVPALAYCFPISLPLSQSAISSYCIDCLEKKNLFCLFIPLIIIPNMMAFLFLFIIIPNRIDLW